jgi:hypothetical protein
MKPTPPDTQQFTCLNRQRDPDCLPGKWELASITPQLKYTGVLPNASKQVVLTLKVEDKSPEQGKRLEVVGLCAEVNVGPLPLPGHVVIIYESEAMIVIMVAVDGRPREEYLWAEANARISLICSHNMEGLEQSLKNTLKSCHLVIFHLGPGSSKTAAQKVLELT